MGQNAVERDTLLYRYHGLYISPNSLPQDCYMEFYLENGVLKKGFYWGTSDEFEDVREGYRCGFFVLPMEDIKCGKDSVSFRLKPFSSDGYHSDSTFVKAPVNLHVRSREKALSLYQLWEHNHIKPDGIKMSIMFAAPSDTFPVQDTIRVKNLLYPHTLEERKNGRPFVLLKDRMNW